MIGPQGRGCDEETLEAKRCIGGALQHREGSAREWRRHRNGVPTAS